VKIAALKLQDKIANLLDDRDGRTYRSWCSFVVHRSKRHRQLDFSCSVFCLRIPSDNESRGSATFIGIWRDAYFLVTWTLAPAATNFLLCRKLHGVYHKSHRLA